MCAYLERPCVYLVWLVSRVLRRASCAKRFLAFWWAGFMLNELDDVLTAARLRTLGDFLGNFWNLNNVMIHGVFALYFEARTASFEAAYLTRYFGFLRKPRYVLAVNAVLLWLRLLHCLSIHPKLG